MRITATESTEGVVISLGNSPYDGRIDSVGIKHSEVKGLTIEEGTVLLHRKLGNLLPTPENKVRGVVEAEIVEVEREPLEVELDGDEDDEDLTLYEEVVDIVW